jgi:O-methyltransferase
MITTKKKIMFGTGPNAEILLKKSRFEIEYVIDNFKTKGMFHGKPIYNPSVITDENIDDIYVYLTFSPSGATYRKIAEQLNKLGLQEGIHFSSMFDAFQDDFPYEEIKPLSNFSPWREDKEFFSVYQEIKNNTLVDIYRCYELWSLVEESSKLERGVLVEVGVWKGGTGALIAKKAKLCGIEDSVYLCDTFNGVVKANPSLDNVYKGGEHDDTSVEIVTTLIEGAMQLDNVKILKGIFPDDSGINIIETSIRFCHIDVDVFLSAKGIFEWVWSRMVIGGMVVFDDYGFMTCEGITKYVNQLKSNRRMLFIHNINGHGILVKLCE